MNMKRRDKRKFKKVKSPYPYYYYLGCPAEDSPGYEDLTCSEKFDCCMDGCEEIIRDGPPSNERARAYARCRARCITRRMFCHDIYIPD